MDLGTAIIGAISIAIFALPFVLYNRGNKKREKGFLQSLSKIALQNSCQISQHEIVGNSAIGIDETRNYVFFYHQVADKATEQFADLSEMQNCKVINISKNSTFFFHNLIVLI